MMRFLSKKIEKVKKKSLKNWKKKKRPQVGVVYVYFFYKFQDLLCFYENKTAKSLQLEGTCAKFLKTNSDFDFFNFFLA